MILPLPDQKQGRSVDYICGPSGCGKSFFSKKFLKSLSKKKPVYLFSAVDDDNSLEGLSNFNQIAIDDGIFDDPFEISDFKDSIVIFDDCCALQKDLRAEVEHLRNQILTTGRHHGTDCIVTNHQCTDGKDTRESINEAHAIIVFPFGTARLGIDRILKNYVGLCPKAVNYIYETCNKNGSRWCYIYKNYPIYIVTEHSIKSASSF